MRKMKWMTNPEELQKGPKIQNRKNANRSVLVVDGEPEIAELVEMVMVSRGFRSDLLNNGDAALDTLRHQDYDLLICDYHMPGTDGHDLLQWIRSNHKDTRVLVLSGDIIRPETRGLVEMGGGSFLAKPFSLSALSDAVDQVMS